MKAARTISTVHRIEISPVRIGMRFGDLKRGMLFQYPSPANPENIYLKTGTRVVNLRTGEDYSVDQEKIVEPLPDGSIITLTVGVGSNE